MRGGFVVDMRWKKGEISELKILSRLGGNLRLRTYAPLPKTMDFIVKNARGENKNPFYSIPDIKKPLIHTVKKRPILSLDNTYLVDVKTKAGTEYRWVKAPNQTKIQ